MLPLLINILALTVAMAAGYGIAWRLGGVVAGFGEQKGIVSHVNERSSHERPTSRLGGIGLAAGFFIPFLALIAALWFSPRGLGAWGGDLPFVAWLLVGGLVMFGVGLADDVWELSPLVKFVGQVFAALILIPADLRCLEQGFIALPGIPPHALAMAVSIAWVVFFVNVFNFMDGMDGFATRFAMSSCAWIFGTVVARAVISGDLLDLRIELFIAPVLGAACAGFYRVNRSPAKVFMGDGGSHLLGYFIAILILLGDGDYFIARKKPVAGGTALPLLGGMIILLPFLFDAILTLLRRARRGENLLAAHREHLYQRLMIAGGSHEQVLRANLPYFRICGAIGMAYALVPAVVREVFEEFDPRWIFWPRIALLAAAPAVMGLYWRSVLKKEKK